MLDSEGGELRAVSDIGTHWLDLIYFITELEVEAVCADLQTVHPVRKRPTGEIATFQGKGQTFLIRRIFLSPRMIMDPFFCALKVGRRACFGSRK